MNTITKVNNLLKHDKVVPLIRKLQTSIRLNNWHNVLFRSRLLSNAKVLLEELQHFFRSNNCYHISDDTFIKSKITLVSLHI